MSDPAPSAEDVAAQIRSTDRFSKLVEEIAERFYDQEYKDDRIPDIKASFREEAEEAGLSEGEANGVAGRLIGVLTSAAEEEAPPPPESKWDALEPESGPLPEDRYDELPGPFYQLLRLVETETEPFRQVHRLIDAVEWAVKWHTTLALSDLLAQGDVPEPVKVLLAEKLQTPSLGTWNRFFRNAVGAFEDIDADPALPWDRFERLTGLEGEHHLVNFRNRYGHGATPPPEECREDVETYRPILRELINTPLFTDVRLAVRGEGETPQRLTGPDRTPAEDELETDLPEGHAAAILPEASGRAQIDLWPLGLAAAPNPDDAQGIETVEAGRAQFFFFNALRNRKAVEQLNYEGPVHRRDEGLYDSFMGELPLRAWREETSAELTDFAREVAALTESFKGRREERAQLRGFAAGGEGTLMVYGAPGIGKSALLAQVIQEIEAGVDADGRELTDEKGDPIDPPPVIEFFIRRAEGKDDPTRFLRYLCRHLDERYDLDGQGLGSEPVELQEQLSARLQAIEENASEDEGQSQPERTVLLVDGLDEAPELGRYVPESRPWLPVIVASRETPEATEFYEGRRRETRSQVTVGPLGKREVRAILYEGANKYDPAFDEEYVEVVAERSEGNPLYLTLLAEELFQGEIEVGDIKALPEEIGELYGETVRRVTDEGENQTALNLLHLLAEAKAPLTAGAVAELLEINAMQASSAVRDAMELLHEASPEALYPTSEDAPEEAVQLFHESLREWLREEHTAACREMQERLAGKTAEWDERRNETAQRYALRYGAIHQWEAGRPEELYDLLSGEDYQGEQVRVFKQYDATFASYEAGLEAYVERDGETPEDDARLCRLALDAGEAAREAKEGVTQAFRWAEDGRMEDALQRIEVLGEEKYFLAALRLLWIEADRQGEKPEEERSKETAQKVLDAVEERIAPGTEAIDWSGFADESFMVRWAERVLNVLPSLDLSGPLVRTSGADDLNDAFLARLEAEQNGDLEALGRCALHTARSIDRSTDYLSSETSALSAIVESLVEIGQVEQATIALELALKAARSIDSDRDRAKALSDATDALSNLGEHEQLDRIFEWALDIARSIDSDRRRAEALSEVASALSRAGAFEQALDTARSIDSDRRRAKALSEVASALAENGAFDQALTTAESIEWGAQSAEALTSISQTFVQAGDFDRALEVARSIGKTRCVRAFTEIASTLVGVGRNEQARSILEDALSIASSSHRDQERSEHLAKIADVFVSAGKPERAVSVLKKALDIAKSGMKDSELPSDVQENIGDTLLHIGKSENIDDSLVKKTIEVSRLVEDPSDLLLSLTSFLSFAGEVEKALEIASSFESQSKLSGAITYALSSQGRYSEALDIAHSISEDEPRAQALAVIGRHLADEEHIDRALEVARSIDDSAGNPIQPIQNPRSETLAFIVSALVEAGRFEKAVDSAELIEDRTTCATSLSEIVSGISEARGARSWVDSIDQVARIARDIEKAIPLAAAAALLANAGKTKPARSHLNQATIIASNSITTETTLKVISALWECDVNTDNRNTEYVPIVFESIFRQISDGDSIWNMNSSKSVADLDHHFHNYSRAASLLSYSDNYLSKSEYTKSSELFSKSMIYSSSLSHSNYIFKYTSLLRTYISNVPEKLMNEDIIRKIKEIFEDDRLPVFLRDENKPEYRSNFVSITKSISNKQSLGEAFHTLEWATDIVRKQSMGKDHADDLSTYAIELLDIDLEFFTEINLAAIERYYFPLIPNIWLDRIYNLFSSRSLEKPDGHDEKIEMIYESNLLVTCKFRFFYLDNLSKKGHYKICLDEAEIFFDNGNLLDWYSDSIKSIAYYIAREGSFQSTDISASQIIEAALKIPEEKQRSDALRAVADTQLKFGNLQAARSTLQKALEASDESPETTYDPDSLVSEDSLKAATQVASRLPDAGSLADTHTLFETCFNRGYQHIRRDEALGEIASLLISAGEGSAVLKTADSFQLGDSDDIHFSEERRYRAEMFSTLSTAFAQEEMQDHAIAAVSRIPDADKRYADKRSSSLRTVASSYASVHDFKKAVGIALSINKKSYRALALSDIAFSMSSRSYDSRLDQGLDLLERSLRVADSIESDRSCARTLKEISSGISTENIPNGTHFYKRITDCASSIEELEYRIDTFLNLTYSFKGSIDRDNIEYTLENILDDILYSNTSNFSSEKEILFSFLSISVELDLVHLTIPFLNSVPNTPANNFDLERSSYSSDKLFFLEKVVEECSEKGRLTSLLNYLDKINLTDDEWCEFIPTWYCALIKNTNSPPSSVRRSLLLHPFDMKTAGDGVFAMVQAFIQTNEVDHTDAVIENCPELNLDLLRSDHNPDSAPAKAADPKG